MSEQGKAAPAQMSVESMRRSLDALVSTGREMGSGAPFSVLFRRMLRVTIDMLGAEGGSLYIYDDIHDKLKIVLMLNDKLGVNSAVRDFDPLQIKGIIEVPLFDESGRPFDKAVSVHSFLLRETVTVSDVYAENETYDFANVRKFDSENNYRTDRIMAVPLIGHNDRSIGVMQIINPAAGRMEGDDLRFVETMSAQMGVALDNAILVSELRNLLVAFVNMIGLAIDEKSPHTAGHCQRVTELTMMFAESLNDDTGRYADFRMSGEEMQELRMAGLLHDVGKIITPSHILEKSTKLSGVYDGIDLIRERLRAREAERRLRALESKVREAGREDLVESAQAEPSPLPADALSFLEKLNSNAVFLDEAADAKLREISEVRLEGGDTVLNDREVGNLRIKRGTLSAEERQVMEDHVSISIRLLSSLPWPRQLRRVTEYAAGHHEHMNGGGYPNHLTGEQMSLQARILGIADRFEGLAAPDRPYRKMMTLSRVLSIMEAMRREGQIDSDLYDFFLEKKIYRQFADKHLPTEVVDCE